MAAENYYEVLGLKKGVSDEAVKQAFRDHAKLLHPDRNPDDPDAERRFKMVNTAYEALKDEARRRAYDEWLAFARRTDRSRLAQWGRLAALVTLLLLGPSIALYWAFILLEGWDKPRTPRPAASVNVSGPVKPGPGAERRDSNPASKSSSPAGASQPQTEAALQAELPSAGKSEITSALPPREELAPAARSQTPAAKSAETSPRGEPSARRGEPPAERAETPAGSPPLPPRAPEAAPATTPPQESRNARRPLREIAGIDEEGQPPQTPRPATPPRESSADRTAADPAGAQEGAARSMARLIAELKEPGGPLAGRPSAFSERQTSPERQLAARDPDEARLPPDDEAPPQRGGASAPEGDGDDFSDCERCPLMSVVTATDLAPPQRSARGRSGRSLAISKFEVTIAEWNACAQEGACQGLRNHSGGTDRPVADVTRAEAAEYAEWLSRKTGRPYRLMKVGGWSRPPERGGEETPWARPAPRSAQECGGPDWRWLDDEECMRRFRQSERAARGGGQQQPYQTSSGFRVARSLGPDG